ncbi:MAG: ABC transporter ATP-binding protein [Mediterranea sp.]|jgi:putative ABC transport system ATP-binding protein|nr:ABC transporter ATP-binding protein [Mediterranea sp.]
MIRLNRIHKAYTTQFNKVDALNGVSLSVEQGEMLAIMGASGSGKSTLMNIIGLLDKYDEGEYYLNDILMKNLSKEELAMYRNQYIGFVFQSANLIAYKNILENVALPLYYRGISRKERNEKAMENLQLLGLRGWERHYPNELSGGQRQRVAIARAIISNPALILADEPTGQLDSTTSDEVMQLFKEVNKNGTTVILVTHEQRIAEEANRIIHIKDGILT